MYKAWRIVGWYFIMESIYTNNALKLYYDWDNVSQTIPNRMISKKGAQKKLFCGLVF